MWCLQKLVTYAWNSDWIQCDKNARITRKTNQAPRIDYEHFSTQRG